VRIGVGRYKKFRGQYYFQRTRQKVVALTSFCVYRCDFQICDCDKRPYGDKNQEVNLARGGSQGVGIIPIGHFICYKLWPRGQEVVVSTHHIQPCQALRATEQSVICEEEGERFEEALRATLLVVATRS